MDQVPPSPNSLDQTEAISTMMSIEEYHILRPIWVWINTYYIIPFSGEWTSIYQLFWCSLGVQGFETLPYNYGKVIIFMDVYSWDITK